MEKSESEILDEVQEITHKERLLIDMLQEGYTLSLEEINKKITEKQQKYPKLGLLGCYKLFLRDMDIPLPEFLSKEETKQIKEVKKKMAKKPAKLPVNKPGKDLEFEKRIYAKLEGYSFAFSSMNDHLKSISDDVSIWKNLETRLVSLLETLLARMESIGNVTAQSASTPAPVPAFVAPTHQISSVLEATAIQPAFKPVPVPTVPQVPQINTMALPTNAPAQTAPVQSNPNVSQGPKPRLPMDGSAEHGKADLSKNWTYYTVLATPTEFTADEENGGYKAMKASFIFLDKNNIQRISWNKDYNSAELWIAKSLTHPDSIIKRLQMQQQIQVPNWWAEKNSVPMAPT